MKTLSLTQQANQHIAGFFDHYHLPEAITATTQLMEYACSDRYYKKTSPVSMLLLADKLKILTTAAEIIYYSAGKQGQVIINCRDVATIKHAYSMDSTCGQSASGGFISHLNAEEYLNPYLVMETIATASYHPGWDTVIADLLEFALSRGSIDGCYTSAELMRIKEELLALVEAAYLIHWRSEHAV